MILSARRCWFAVACLAASIAIGAETNTTSTVRVGDWPQWGGPNRDSVSTETGLMRDWTKSPPPLAWTGEKLGSGYSGVSIQDGHIYTMGLHDGNECVVALDEADGKRLWLAKIGPTGDNGGSDKLGPRCTPASDGDRVYALTSQGDLACLNSADGTIRWAKNLKKDFGGRGMNVWGYSESPLVDGDRLICTPGGKDAAVVALDKQSGNEIWRCAVPQEKGKGNGAGYSSVVISNGAGVRQYVQLLGQGLVGIRCDDGKLLWTYTHMANATANICTPIVQGDYVFDSTAYRGGAGMVKLSRTDDGVKATEVYFIDPKQISVHHGGMVLVDGYVYGGHGQNQGAPFCLDFKTGKIVWKEKHGAGTGSAAVAYADGRLYFRYQDGTMALLDCSPKGYKVLGTFAIPDVKLPSWPHPVIAGGKLYLREQDKLYCYNLK